MALAKADAGIAAHYDRQLVPPELQPLGAALRARSRSATDACSPITGHHELLEDNRVLRRSIDVRNPYVDPINLLQVELLRRLAVLREEPEPQRDPDARDRASAALKKALKITISGVAAGMRNTG